MSNTEFKKLRKDMTRDERNQADRKYRAYRTAMILGELRTRLHLKQTQSEKALGTAVPHLSQCEISGDMTLQAMCEMVERMGGRLEINAIMPDGVVQLVRAKSPARHEPSNPAEPSGESGGWLN